MTSMLLALALFALAGGQPADPPTVIVSREWTQYSALIGHHDVEALTNLYTPDARVMESGLDDVVGRAAIHDLLIYAFAQRFRPVDIHMMPREVFGYEGVIYDLGDYIETLAPQSNPRGAYDVYGRYFAVWAQQVDGSWKIARIMHAPKKQPSR